MKNTNLFDFERIIKLLKSDDKQEVAIAVFFIQIGLSKFEEKLNSSTYENLIPCSIGEIKEAYSKIKQWNPLYKEFRPEDKTEQHDLLIHLCIGYENEWQDIYRSFEGNRSGGIANHNILGTLKAIGVEDAEDFEDFLQWLDINGYELDPYHVLRYQYR